MLEFTYKKCFSYVHLCDYTRGYKFTYMIAVITNAIDVLVVEIFSRFPDEGSGPPIMFEETGNACK